MTLERKFKHKVCNGTGYRMNPHHKLCVHFTGKIGVCETCPIFRSWCRGPHTDGKILCSDCRGGYLTLNDEEWKEVI